MDTNNKGKCNHNTYASLFGECHQCSFVDCYQESSDSGKCQELVKQSLLNHKDRNFQQSYTLVKTDLKTLKAIRQPTIQNQDFKGLTLFNNFQRISTKFCY